MSFEVGLYFVKDIERLYPKAELAGSLSASVVRCGLPTSRERRDFKRRRYADLADFDPPLLRLFLNAAGEEYVFMDFYERFTQYMLSKKPFARKLAVLLTEETQGIRCVDQRCTRSASSAPTVDFEIVGHRPSVKVVCHSQKPKKPAGTIGHRAW